jgi:Concanavalin A-like lectin/glucanases superfamily/Domain of unknown function (DUF1929)/Glyoxal oxidase N-terminus/Galactose oxidase, central domain/Kelch motif
MLSKSPNFIWLVVVVLVSVAVGGGTADAEKVNRVSLQAALHHGTHESRSAALPAAVNAPAASAADPAVVGEWTAPFTIPAKGIHASVLPTGEVLWFSYPVAEVGSDVWLWNPQTGSTTNASLTTQRDVFCVAQSFLPDGRIFMTGGHAFGTGYGFGVKDTDFFDPTSRTWTEGHDLSIERWYPTNVELGNGNVLVFGGQKDNQTTSDTVESYDPATNTLTTLPATATKKVNSYPRLHLLPSGKISFTNQRRTQMFNPSTNTWSAGPIMNFGGRGVSGHSVLLPGLTKVLDFGGKAAGATSATNTAEIIDFAAPSPQWRNTAPMSFPRMYGNPVVLPDGKVLVVGGGRGPGIYDNPVQAAELFDPVAETWTTMAPQVAPRIYHSTAVLLPDGRVVSAGQDKGSYQFTAEIYSPPYLFKGPRPQITSTPAEVGYDQTFTISTPDASSIERVTLVRPDSVTHSVNFDQRYVDLPFSVGAGSISATSPPTGNHAPPGPYMLFVVSSSGVPSVASWVMVGDSGGSASYYETVLADLPAGYWRLGETTGGAVDETGGPAGTYNGGLVRGVPGALLGDSNPAARFDGVDDYVSVPDHASLDVGDSFTYELWVRRGVARGVSQRIIHKGGGAAALGFGTNNKLVLVPGGSGASAIASSSIAINDSNWHHVVATKSGASAHIYLDGVDVTAPGTNTTTTSNATALNIGRATTGTGYFDGDIDELAIYPVALTQAQVLEHLWAR